MKWEDYYDRFWDWEDSTRISRISSITDFTSADEVVELAGEFYDEQAASRLVKRAIRSGIRFSPTQILELGEWVDEETSHMMIENRRGEFSSAQKAELEDMCIVCFDEEDPDDDELQAVASHDPEGMHDGPKQEMKADTKTGLFSFLFGKQSQTGAKGHSGRCNGDCRNCPEHYGYRYGRWYYGHHHSHGCEFGGNDGSGRA